MKAKEKTLNKTLGNVLLNDLKLDTGVIHKGHIIDETDVFKLEIMGVEKIFVAELEGDEVDLKTAQGIVTNKICGKNTSYVFSEGGIVNILANVDGVFISDEERAKVFNRLDQDIILNIITPYKSVKAGDIIAKLDFDIPAFSQKKIKDIVFSLSGNVETLSVEETKEKKATMLYIDFYKNNAERKHFSNTFAKLSNQLDGFGVEFTKDRNSEYKLNKISDNILNIIESGIETIFISGSMKLSGKGDIYSSIKEVCEDFIIEDFHKIGLKDFFIGVKKNIKIIALPYNYSILDTTLLDDMIRRTITNHKFIAPKSVVHDVFLSHESSNDKSISSKKLVEVRDYIEKNQNIAIIILAAGLSKRAMKNKLLFDYNNKPLFMNSVLASIEANIGPVYLITGYENKKIEEHLQKHDINIIHNPMYREGVKGSIKLGLNFIPEFCKGAILLPADMPNISSKHLQNMAEKFDNRKSKQLLITSYKGKRYNPILWSKSLFPLAEIIPEHQNQRMVMVEFEDLITEIEVVNKKEIIDINYLADIEDKSSFF